jgi:hypothetical protein
MLRAQPTHPRRFGPPLQALLALTLVLAAPVSMAANLAGPSLAPMAQEAQFSGLGFKPNSKVTVTVVRPDGLSSSAEAVVAADGSLTYRVTPAMQGMHQVSVLNAKGKALAQANFIANGQ